MPGNDLQAQHEDGGASAQGGTTPARDRDLRVGMLDAETFEEITGSFVALGALNTSRAAAQRIILLAFARSEDVRNAVRQAMPRVMDPAA